MEDVAALSDDDLRQQLVDYGVNVGPIVSSTRLFYEKKLAKVITFGKDPPPQRQDTESEARVPKLGVYFPEEKTTGIAPITCVTEGNIVEGEKIKCNWGGKEVIGVVVKLSEEEEDEYEEEEEEEDEEVQINNRKEPQMVRPPPSPPRTHAPAGYTPITQQRRASPTRATSATQRTGKSATSQVPKPTGGPALDKKKAKNGGGMALWIKLLFVIIVAVLIYLVIINVNPSAQNKIPLSLNEEI